MQVGFVIPPMRTCHSKTGFTASGGLTRKVIGLDLPELQAILVLSGKPGIQPGACGADFVLRQLPYPKTACLGPAIALWPVAISITIVTKANFPCEHRTPKPKTAH
jgi:hypothetical protein